MNVAGDRSLQAEVLLGLLAERARPGERPEEVLLDLGLVSDRDFAMELAVRSGLPFTDLRDFVPDERLFLYVPLVNAISERVVPIVLVDDRLHVASVYLQPRLEGVRRHFPKLDLAIEIAPRGQVLAALNAVAREL
ncbi:MAG TPA: hypothetical protein VFJ91_05360 [Gaiellaceae bacterium]|nr:hypothetical protein [Gaiellaceae bacterium]